MLQNSNINFICRLICFVTFSVVLILVKSFVTLSLLTIVFYLFTRNEKKIILLQVISFIIYLLCYFFGGFYLLKIILIVDFCYYFLKLCYYEKQVVLTKENVKLDKYAIRFANIKKKRKGVINNNLYNTIYVTVHISILFITIMVG